jgi:hypothetical protein
MLRFNQPHRAFSLSLKRRITGMKIVMDVIMENFGYKKIVYLPKNIFY